MAFGPVLYRPNLYGKADYSTNPPLLVATDSITETDAIAGTVSTVAADSMSAMTDSSAVTVGAAASDMLPTSDASGAAFTTALTDFFICKEFIAAHVTRAQNWTVGGPSRTVTPHIYGKVLYAKNMYSTNIALLWAATKKDVTPTFTNVNGHKYNS